MRSRHQILFFEFIKQSNSCHLHNMLAMLLKNASARTLSQDMFSIWYSTRMAIPILYHLLFDALFHPVSICFSAYKSPTSSFIIFIYIYLEFSVFVQCFSWNMEQLWHCCDHSISWCALCHNTSCNFPTRSSNIIFPWFSKCRKCSCYIFYYILTCISTFHFLF